MQTPLDIFLRFVAVGAGLAVSVLLLALAIGICLAFFVPKEPRR